MAEQVDPETGLEFFIFMGQKRYRCPAMWEGGGRCQRDHYDPQWIRDHAKQPHTAMGEPAKAAPVKRKATSSLVDSSGKRLVYDVPEDLDGIHFKK